MKSLKGFIDKIHGISGAAINRASEIANRWAKREEYERETEFYNELDELTGVVADLGHFRKQDKAKSQTRLMSDEMADRSERLGIGGYHQGELIRIIAPLSQSVEEIPPYRRNNSIPYIAQQKRSNTLKELIYYVQMESQKKGVCFRQWVIHDGPRCTSVHLKKRWQAQNRKIREWNKYHAAKYGASIEFRSNEAGSPLKKSHERTLDEQTGKWSRSYVLDDKGQRVRALDENGCQTWHPHTHCLVRMDRYLSDSEFENLIQAAQKHFQTPKLDSGAVREPREICKYVVKCADLKGISDIDFMRFLRRTKGLHLVQPLGGLRDQIREHKASCLKLRARYDSKTQTCFYKLLKNHNQSAITGKKSKAQEIADREKALEEFENPTEKKNLEKCAIVARLSPQAHFLPVAEPLFMVRGRVDLDEFCRRKEVAEIILHCQAAYLDGLDAFEVMHGYSAEQWLAGRPAGKMAGYVARWRRPEASIFKGSAHNTPATGKCPDEPRASFTERASFVGDYPPTARLSVPQNYPISAPQKNFFNFRTPEKTKPADLSTERASFVGEMETNTT